MNTSFKNSFVFAVVALLISCVALPVSAETRKEQKLFQVGGPESRVRCVQEGKTKGIPQCEVRNWTLKCEDTWVTACTGHATDFMQHEYFLVVSGPDAPDALRKVLDTALTRSLAFAVGAAIGTPGEASIKIAAAFTAFKLTLATELAVEPILAAMRDQFELSIRTSSSW